MLRSSISSTCRHNMVNFGILAAEILSLVWGTPANFNNFTSWQPYCTALQYWVSAKLCGVELRAPPIFSRAAIMLGICPHSRFVYEISLEPLNGFAPNSHERCVWSMSLTVEVTRDKNGIFQPFPQSVCGLFGETSLASSC